MTLPALSLRWRLRLYLLALHVVFLGFTLALYGDEPALFILLEVLLLASLAGGFYLVNRALEPLDYTRRFHDLLQEQNYAAQLQPGQGVELNELIGLFNRMLGALYQERLQIGEQRGFLDKLLEATPSAVLVFDFDGGISLLNVSAQALLGLHQPKGKPLAHWLEAGQDPAARFSPALSEAARLRSMSLLAQLDALPLAESRLISDVEGRRYRVQRGHFFDRGFARHFLLVEELTEELESSEKATYEKLIRVLAHEVNNTVAATGSVLDSLLFYSRQLTEADQADFATAIGAAKRRNTSLAEFIERFTRVVKMPVPELRPTGVAQMLDDIIGLYREPCKALGVDLQWTRRDAAVPDVMLDRQLMEQALLNVVKNAIEAVQMTLAQAAATGGHVNLALAHDVQSGRIRLSVTDSGDRLGEVPTGQLFSPFFTTKRGGQGIGLLFVREVLQRHGFAYRLAATGTGETCFEVWLA
jgi:nitrogen fixation/metabolism regulation signal transduction histidine kinase